MAELARRCGLSRSHLSRIRRGSRVPSLKSAARIARVLGITMEQLFRRIRRRRNQAAASILRPRRSSGPDAR